MDKLKIKQNDIAGSKRKKKRKRKTSPQARIGREILGDAGRGMGHVSEGMAESSSSIRWRDWSGPIRQVQGSGSLLEARGLETSRCPWKGVGILCGLVCHTSVLSIWDSNPLYGSLYLLLANLSLLQSPIRINASKQWTSFKFLCVYCLQPGPWIIHKALTWPGER